ncbi:MAG: hypothetical protein ACTSYT_04955 [Candidatus Asgardarchaeia archaeon]
MNAARNARRAFLPPFRARLPAAKEGERLHPLMFIIPRPSNDFDIVKSSIGLKYVQKKTILPMLPVKNFLTLNSLLAPFGLMCVENSRLE